MCGRFSFSPDEIIIEERFDIEIEEGLYTPRYNCAPSQNLAVISSASPEKLSLYRWGLIPFWAKDKSIGNRMINARAESILEKASFKMPFKKQRCLVLCDGFFEWKKMGNDKKPFRIVLKENKLFSMAGIWDTWKEKHGDPVYSFAVITTDPNSMMASIHNRMPVILPSHAEDEWLRSDHIGRLIDMLQPYPADEMEAYEVSKLVNSPANDSPEVIKKIN